MPEDFISDDLKETARVWKRVQNSRNVALHRHDEVYLIAADETWAADARVAHAKAVEVQLVGVKIFNLDQRTKPLLKTEEYEVQYITGSYAVFRRSDGHRMTGFVSDEVLAERDLRRLYPRPA